MPHMFSRLLKELSKQEGITEKMKAEQPLFWIGRENG